MTRADVLVDELKRKLPEMTSDELNEVRNHLNLLGLQNREETMRRQKMAEGKVSDNNIKRVDLDSIVPLSSRQRTYRLQKIFYLTERQYRRYKKLISTSVFPWWLEEEKAVNYQGKTFTSESTQFWSNGRKVISVQRKGIRPLLRFVNTGLVPPPGSRLRLTAKIAPVELDDFVVLDKYTAILEKPIMNLSWEEAQREKEKLEQFFLSEDNDPKLELVSVGFGKYPTGRYGDKETIRWQIIGQNKGSLLLLSDRLLSMEPYDKVRPDFQTWEESNLREWLNNDFYEKAFSLEEQARIVPARALATTAEGEKQITSDKVFILNEEEIRTLLPNPLCKPTACSLQQFEYNLPEAFRYWLRSDIKNRKARIVDEAGNFCDKIYYTKSVGVRPAIWIRTGA